MDDKKTKKSEKSKTEEIDLVQKVAELEDQLKRAVADYRNLEKRVEEEKRDIVKFANRELLMTLLPSFDMLFLAEKYVADDGLKLTIKALSDSLLNVGVTRIESTGKEFDPHMMEAVETVEGEENIVMEEVRPGFALYGKLLRPAVVKVGKSSE